MAQLKEYMIKQMVLRNYSVGTITQYVRAVTELTRYYRRRPDELNASEVQDYLYYLVKKRKLAWNTVHLTVAGLKYFYHDHLGRPKERFTIPAAKKSKRLPIIWSPEEIRKLAEVAYDLMTKTMILTAYATGMRASEVVRMKVKDIDSQHLTLWVRQGKGKKDRAALLTPSLLTKLRIYWKAYRPKKWLFPSKGDPAKVMHPNTFGARFRRVKKAAGFQRSGSIHSLRHSFATHLIARGTDVETVRKLLGHANLSTTMVYIHLAQSIVLSKAKNLDLLELRTLRT